MAYKKIAFTREGFRETVTAGDSLYIFAPFGQPLSWPVSLCVLPQGAASANVFHTFMPLAELQKDITSGLVYWHSWPLGTLTSASAKLYDSFDFYFSCVKVEASVGNVIVEGGK